MGHSSPQGRRVLLDLDVADAVAVPADEQEAEAIDSGGVVAGGSVDVVALAVLGVDDVVVVASVEAVRTGFAGEVVTAVRAEQLVRAGAAVQRVVAVAPAHVVVVVAAVDGVVAALARDRVLAVVAVERVVAL